MPRLFESVPRSCQTPSKWSNMANMPKWIIVTARRSYGIFKTFSEWMECCSLISSRKTTETRGHNAHLTVHKWWLFCLVVATVACLVSCMQVTVVLYFLTGILIKVRKNIHTQTSQKHYLETIMR